ncbi:MAG: hypothetical protein WBD36_02360 [Bacteroidota bacterium]
MTKTREDGEFKYEVTEGRPLTKEEADEVAQLVAKMIFDNLKSQSHLKAEGEKE